ncbi:MAG: hypothetical protein VX712_04780 [Bacteroidota bacterium]|nr:hypothetical protein [Bacteroidota bacterium]
MLRKAFLIICGLGFLHSCSKDEPSTKVQISENSFLFAATQEGQVKRYNINTGKVGTYSSGAGDITGLYGLDVDSLAILSMTDKSLKTFGISGNALEERLEGSQSLEHPHDLAVNNSFFVVADDADADGDPLTEDSRLFVFQHEGSSLKLRNVIFLNFRVWAVEFMGDDLLVSHKTSNKLAVFNDFLENRITNVVRANKTVTIEGVTRIYGMDFEDNLLVLSDIGTETADNDGSLQIMPDFQGVLNGVADGAAIPVDDQLVLQGANTKLGNPVKVVYDSEYNVIFVAEQLNGGGRIVAFNNARSAKGNLAPDLNYPLAKVSAIYFYTR